MDQGGGSLQGDVPSSILEGCASKMGTRMSSNVILDVGTSVELIALKGRPDLNGQRGLIRSWDIERGRYGVRVGNETVAIRPSNLVPVADMGLESLREDLRELRERDSEMSR